MEAQDYLKGGPLPGDQEYEKPCLLYYGAYMWGKNGGIRHFVYTYECEIPRPTLEVHREMLTHKEASEKGKAIARRLRDIRDRKIPPPPIAPGAEISDVGRFAVHEDHAGKHMAILVEIGPYFHKALFFTSNPNWGEYSRKATKEELAHTGFVYTRTTYLVGVVRPAYEFSVMERSVPPEYVARYKEEFRL